MEAKSVERLKVWRADFEWDDDVEVVRASDYDQLRTENERLKLELAARHPFRPAEPAQVLGHTGCVICGAFTDHGGLQCPKLLPFCVSQEVNPNG